MKTKCPRCGTIIETGAAAPGSPLTCSCGNVITVPKKKFPIWLILGIVAVVGCVPCVGILAAIAIPNFIRFQARAKQTECRVNLKSFQIGAMGAQAAADEGAAPPLDLATIGFSPERGNRYAYFLEFDGPIEDRSSEAAFPPDGVRAIAVDTFKHKGKDVSGAQVSAVSPVQPGVVGTCPDCGVVMVCAGNVDNDETLDVWSIATVERTLPDGTPVEAGEPFHHVNDVTD